MADDEEFYIDGRAISELRVVDLKKECEKRELSKSGSKFQLMERLKAQLLLEKLQKLPVDQDAEAPNLKLQDDEVAGSNEFIKQYLRRQKELLKLQREESSQESDYSQEESPQKGSSPQKPPVKVREKEQDFQEESQLQHSEEAEESRSREEVNMGTRRKFSSHSTEEMGNQENTEPVLKGKRTRTRSQRESERETDGASPVKEVAQKPGDESHKGDERVLEERNMQEKEEHDAERQDTKTEESNREVTKDGVKSEGIEISSSRDQTRKKYVEKEDVMTRANETPMETEDAQQHRKTKYDKKGDKKGEKGRSRSSSSASRSRSKSGSGSSRSSSESPPRSKLKGRVERKRPSSSRDRSESPPKSKLKGKGERKRSWSSSRSSSESPQKFKGQVQKRRSRSGSESHSRSPEKKKTKAARRRSSSSSSSRSRSKSKEKSRSRSADSRSSSSRSRSRSQSRSPSRSPKLRSPPSSRLKSQPLNTVVRDESSFHTASEDTPVKDQMCSPEQSSGMETDTVEIKSKQSDIPLAPEKEEGELPQESEPKEQKKSSRRISLTRGEKDGEKEEDKEHSQQTEGLGEKPLRKRKWGSKTASAANKPPRKATSLAISTDSLKGLISDIKPSMLNEASLDLDVKDEGVLSDQKDTRDVKIQRTVIQVVKQEADEESSSEEEEKADEEEEGEDDTEEEKQEEAKDKAEKIKATVVDRKDGDERHDVDKENKKKKTIEERVKGEPKIIRRVSNPPLVQPDEPMKAGRGQSPARNPVSRIVHIRNLVRPFTVNQLKELMKRTGNFTDEGFWIDKIKSHCYVTYSTEEEAMATRKALHGTRWPQSNPKILVVDYGTEDEVLHHRNLEVPLVPIQKEKPAPRKEKEKEKERVKEKERERDRKKKEEKKEEVKPIREWDRDKLRQSEERERERRRARSLSRERRQHERSRDRERAKKEKKAPVVEKKVEDEPPAKLLDDLFRKTKVTPCIYWLPLTEAQISERETARKQREVERQKRREEQEKVEEAERKQRIADRAKRRETEERSRSQKDKESLEASPVKERSRNRRQNEDGSRKRLEKSRSPKNQHQRQSRSGEGRRR